MAEEQALVRQHGFEDDEKVSDAIASNISARVSHLRWRTKDGELIRLADMQDSHLRNTALMLMGLGYQAYHAPDDLKIRWLTALRIEWERRMVARRT